MGQAAVAREGQVDLRPVLVEELVAAVRRPVGLPARLAAGEAEKLHAEVEVIVPRIRVGEVDGDLLRLVARAGQVAQPDLLARRDREGVDVVAAQAGDRDDERHLVLVAVLVEGLLRVEAVARAARLVHQRLERPAVDRQPLALPAVAVVLLDEHLQPAHERPEVAPREVLEAIEKHLPIGGGGEPLRLHQHRCVLHHLNTPSPTHTTPAPPWWRVLSIPRCLRGQLALTHQVRPGPIVRAHRSIFPRSSRSKPLSSRKRLWSRSRASFSSGDMSAASAATSRGSTL